jgi:cobalt transporter subunit CbtB
VQACNQPVGDDGCMKEMTMKAQTNVSVDTTDVTSQTSIYAAIGFALISGVVLLTVSGMAQATVLHDAAHDQRHAMAFPCH